MEHFKNIALRKDIGDILEMNITNLNMIYESNVGGFSIEIASSPTCITSYVYESGVYRDEDIVKLKKIIYNT